MTNLHQEIDRLKQETTALGELAITVVADAARALEARDVDRSDDVVARVRRVVRDGARIEKHCLDILALKQPVAIDLRLVVSVLKLKTDLVRIAQQAANIAEEVPTLASSSVSAPEGLHVQAGLVQDMTRDACAALVQLDQHLAHDVIARDDAVDDLHQRMHHLVEEAVSQDPATADSMIRYLKVSRELERMADHAVNICQDVVFIASGELPGNSSDA